MMRRYLRRVERALSLFLFLLTFCSCSPPALVLANIIRLLLRLGVLFLHTFLRHAHAQNIIAISRTPRADARELHVAAIYIIIDEN